MNRYQVTIERQVTERITFTVDGRTKQDAAMAAGRVAATAQEGEWARDVTQERVGKVERVEEPKGDPMDVPPLLQRTAS